MKKVRKIDSKENPFAIKGKSRRPHIALAKQKVDERKRGKNIGGIRKQDVDAKTSQTILAQKQLETDKLLNRSNLTSSNGATRLLKGKKRFVLGSDDEDELILRDGSKFSEIESDKSNMKNLGHKLLTEMKDEDSDNDDDFKSLATSVQLDSLTKKERLKAMIKQTKLDKEKRAQTREDVERLTAQSNNNFTDIMKLLMSTGMVDGKDPSDTRRLNQRDELKPTTTVSDEEKAQDMIPIDIDNEELVDSVKNSSDKDSLSEEKNEVNMVSSSDQDEGYESGGSDETREDGSSIKKPMEKNPDLPTPPDSNNGEYKLPSTEDSEYNSTDDYDTEEEGSDISPYTSEEDPVPVPAMSPVYTTTATQEGAETEGFEEFSDDDVDNGEAGSEEDFDSELGYETMMINRQAAPTKLDEIKNLESIIPDEIMDFYMHANEAIDQWSCFKKQGKLPLPPTFSAAGEAGLDENITTDQLYDIQFKIWKTMFDLWVRSSSSINLVENSLNGVWSLEASNFGLMIVLSIIGKFEADTVQNEALYENIILKIIHSLSTRYKDIFTSCKHHRSASVPIITKGSEVMGLVNPKSQDQLNEEGQYNSSLAGAVVAYMQVVYQPVMTEVFRVLCNGETPKAANYVLPKDSKKNRKTIASLFEDLDKVKCTMIAQDPELSGKFSKIVNSITPEFERIRTRQAIKRMKAAKEGYEGVDAFLESKKEKDIKRKRRDQARLIRRETEAEAEEAAKARAFRLQARGKEQASFDRLMNEQKATIAKISTSQAQSGNTSLGAHRIMKDRKKQRKLGPNAVATGNEKGK